MTTLAELRQASLKEQKQKEQSSRAPETAPEAAPAAPPVPPPAPAAQAPVTAPAVAISNGNGHHAPPPDPAPTKAPDPIPMPSAPGPEAVRAEKFFARMHETLSHKTVYPSGAKVSADMPPALFHRAKRYCLAHGNITLRQVLLDLLTAYLEEEGY